jgi:glycerol-3-phosphate dehydrogenase
MLAWPRAGANFRTLARSEWAHLDGLNTEGLQAVFQYWDAQTDDALLTRAVIASAQSLGAELAMPARFTGAQLHADGCAVSYEMAGREETAAARCVVNATGPWANHVLDRVTPLPPALPIDTVQGTHIILPGQLDRGCYYVEAPQDRRAVFVLPWYGKTLVGTTETVYTGNPAQVRPLAAEIDYLLTVLQHYFPTPARLPADITESFAGLRVLPRANGQPFKRSRDIIFTLDRADRPRLLSIYGGKLTSYRADAEKVLQRLRPSLPDRHPIAATRKLPLTPPE